METIWFIYLSIYAFINNAANAYWVPHIPGTYTDEEDMVPVLEKFTITITDKHNTQ